MFSWIKKPAPTSVAPWGLLVDIHNHVLPGIDDGAQDLMQSQFLLQGLADVGFQAVIATPHIAAGLYLNTPETISQAYDQVQQAAWEEKQWLKGFAAEYMLDDYFDRQIASGLLCLPNPAQKKYVLVELPYMDLPLHWHESIFAMRKACYLPILAHPERYAYIKPGFMLERFRETGLLFQLNLLSLSGYYGKEVKRLAHIYLSEGLYDFAGSDVHHANHLAGLQRMAADPIVSDLIARYPFQNNQIFLAQ
jgi:tyrosine-protein phosphatase YwqE